MAQPALTRQSAPRAVRHSNTPSAITKPARNRWRHHVGVPLSPTSRAVSAGMLCVATSCCCSPTALMKPSAWEPKPSRPIAAIAASPSAPQEATAARSRRRAGASTRNANSRPAVTFTPTPAASASAAARYRGTASVVSASASAIASRISVSLCAPPTAITSSTGFSPTNAAAQRALWPRRPAARAISAIAARLEQRARALKTHRPAASPSGAVR